MEILSIAHKEGRIFITLDKDFGELAIVKGLPHCGIVRLVNLSAKQQSIVCSRILLVHQKDLLEGAIITVERNRVRIRPADKGETEW